MVTHPLQGPAPGPRMDAAYPLPERDGARDLAHHVAVRLHQDHVLIAVEPLGGGLPDTPLG